MIRLLETARTARSGQCRRPSVEAVRRCTGNPAGRRTLQKLPATPPHSGRARRRLVKSFMNPCAASASLTASAAGLPQSGVFASPRHATCRRLLTTEKDSRPRLESVNFWSSVARPRFPSGSWQTWSDAEGRDIPGQRRCRNRGAAGYGCRKRTHVREACGGAIRPGGVGIHCSHGHSGRSVGWLRFPLSVVLRLPGGHPSFRSPLSRGPGLLAALTTRDVGFVRMPAPAGRTASATRRRSPVVNRAVPTPANSVGTSGGWMGRTRTGPRTRLRRP